MPEYGRPRFKLRYYSQGINATAFKTFSTRHEAVGELAILERTGKCKHDFIDPEIRYEEDW